MPGTIIVNLTLHCRMGFPFLLLLFGGCGAVHQSYYGPEISDTRKYYPSDITQIRKNEEKEIHLYLNDGRGSLKGIYCRNIGDTVLMGTGFGWKYRVANESISHIFVSKRNSAILDAYKIAMGIAGIAVVVIMTPLLYQIFTME